MKKLFIVFGSILFVSALTFTSCKKDKKDDGGSNVSVISANGNIIGDDTSEVDNVAALTLSDYDGNGYEAGTSNFKNESFKINLSATVPDKYLSFFDEDDFDGDVKVNPKDAKGCSLGIIAYDSDGDEIGEFQQEDEKEYSWYYAEYIYANKDFTIKGTEKDEDYSYTYDCSFKKGWNIVYSYYKWDDYSEEGKVTTKKPSNMNLKWYYYSEYDWKSNSNHAKKSLFANKLKYKEIID